MVVDEHDVADLEIFIHAASRIRQEQYFNPQVFEHPERECDFLHGIAFVEMEAALHGNHVFAAQAAENQTTLMPFDCGHREIGNFTIRDAVNNFNLVNQTTQSCSEYNGDLWSELGFAADEVSCFCDFFQHSQ
ncbi:hypothetical protein DSECCO2_573530 [anaerobic digester metagenome]